MGVPVTGTIQPTDPALDTYAVIDPIYGIDGWRSVADHPARNAITTLRRRQGMAVLTQDDGLLWLLNAPPWAGDDSDWTAFSGGGGTITLSGDATGTGTASITVTVASYNDGTLFGTMAAQDANAVAITGGTITGLPSPTGGSDAANKDYVDAVTTQLSPRNACDVATTGALTATYDNGTLGVGATLTNSGTQAAISIDGVTLSTSARVLVKDQATQAQNGIYTVTNQGSGSTNWVLTRATDYDQAADVAEGTYTVISSGTANIGTLWIEGNLGPFTIGTTAIAFIKLAVGSLTTTLTGDVTGSGSGTITTTIATNAVTTTKILNAAVTLAKMANMPASRLLGNPTGSAATPQPIQIGTGLSFTGSTLNATAGTVTSVATGTGLTGGPITTTGTISLAAINSHFVLANTTSGSAAPAGVTLSAAIDAAISGTQGVVLYRGVSAWSALTPGTNGQVLTTHGAGADPTWASVGGTGTVTSIAQGGGITLTPNPITTVGTVALSSQANNTVLANISGAPAIPSAATPSAVLDTIGATQGEVLYRDAGGWAVLGVGSSGDVLTSGGAAANPSWTTPAKGAVVYVWDLAIDSMAAVADGIGLYWTVQGSVTFSRADLAATIAPVGASLIVDVDLSSDGGGTWTSLWASNPSNRPTLLTTAKQGSTTSFDTTAATAGDLLRVDIKQVGSTTPGQNIRLQLVAT